MIGQGELSKVRQQKNLIASNPVRGHRMKGYRFQMCADVTQCGLVASGAVLMTQTEKRKWCLLIRPLRTSKLHGGNICAEEEAVCQMLFGFVKTRNIGS